MQIVCWSTEHISIHMTTTKLHAVKLHCKVACMHTKGYRAAIQVQNIPDNTQTHTTHTHTNTHTTHTHKRTPHTHTQTHTRTPHTHTHTTHTHTHTNTQISMLNSKTHKTLRSNALEFHKDIQEEVLIQKQHW